MCGAAERYRQDHPGYCPYRRFSLQQSLLQHFTRYVGMPPQQYRKLSQQRRHGLALPKAENAAGFPQAA